MFNVNHFIVSQVNPHVVPFLVKEEGVVSAQEISSPVPLAPTWLDSLSHLAKGEALHRMHTLADLGILPNLLTKAVSVLSQKYSGDITILPEISYSDFPRMLSNPTIDFMQQALLAGERATWPKISIIKNHCALELALDDAVQKLRARVVFEPEEIEMRRSLHVKRNSYTGSHRTIRTRTNNGRPLSQNSAKEPLQGRPPSRGDSKLKLSTSTLAFPRSGRIGPPLRHRKSRSINSVLAFPTSPQTSRGREELRSPEPSANIRSSQEVTSSGAEDTSNLTSRSSSSTSLDLSSPTEAPSSPVSNALKWSRAHHRSASQPNTPLAYTSPASPATPKASHLGLAMTPAVQEAEPRYKRIFHSNKATSTESSGKKGVLLGKKKGGRTVSGTASGGSGSDSPRTPRANSGIKRNWGLEIDIPSTARGLVGRGKKKE